MKHEKSLTSIHK